ncbi:hypothetical protein, partial [Sphingomonas sp.]|uniref:hypothetical protein n=1 Tax=Sphingomonas sp. TaxID=28214 RepID=UPI0035C837E3
RAAAGPRAMPARFDGARLAGGLPGQAVAIALDPALALVRTVERPAMGERDLDRLLAFDAERIMPLPAEAMVVASHIDRREGSAMQIAVAALPLARAEALATAVTAASVRPARVLLERPEGAIDFLPALRRAGFFAQNRSAARGWWAAVAFLFALNLAMIVWRDVARTDRLEETVAQQQPAVAIARAMANRVRGGQRVARVSLARRAAFDPLGVLARVSTALPAGAWVQRYNWYGDTLKIAGYRPRNANVVTALRAAPGFVEVRNTSSDTVAEIPAGQPFDVTARLGRTR